MRHCKKAEDINEQENFVTRNRLLNKRLTDRNLNNEIVNIVVTAQSLMSQ